MVEGNIITLTLSGTVTTIVPETGAILNKFTTAPLLRSHKASEDDVVVPGLDGLIYEASEKGLELLPFSVLDAQDEPVASCSPPTSSDCTVTWGSHDLTLFGLSPQGSVRWIRNDQTGFTRSSSTWSESREPESASNEPTLLLQRSDYMVRNVDLTTGVESWNVSVSNYEALDFEIPESNNAERTVIEYDEKNKKVFGTRARRRSEGLPRIEVDGEWIHAWRGGEKMWSKRFDSEVKSIYGVEKGNWVEMDVEVTEVGKALQPYTTFDSQDLDLGVLETGEGRVVYVRSSPQSVLLDDSVLLDGPSPSPPKPSQSYRLDSGLFLTWPMITALVCCLVTGVLLGGRVAYKKLKRRWMDKLLNTPVAGHVDGIKMKDLMEGEFELGGKPRLDSNLSNGGHVAVNRSVSMPVITSSNGVESDRSDLSMLRSLSNNADGRGERSADGGGEDGKEKSKDGEKAQKDDEGQKADDRESPVASVQYSRYKSEFTEISQLGRGGFGAVYRCLNTLDGREYAIKKVKVKGGLTKVMREVKILASLEHGNIVRYYNAWLE
eukprot:CAMPEP_0182503238 /NCGR_PEP_ID=MMETSP1321-20130603/14933_1 /TAXON_ID=91990 /ORGANISM="Bolidomonas sp., Strain RCC1657" /LENGTH=549 /DNA_ID=CAMNT_0024708367 /DNA_START=370 /DNA_END=2016 /DNA_ORIENTATION=-